MNKMMGLGDDSTSSINWRRRFSNSPLTLAPACINPISSARNVTPCSEGGTSPSTILFANPSTTAVLPTPASPTSIGLFWRRRSSMSINCRISASRPTILSILPERACSVRSTENFSRASPSPTGEPAARDVAPETGPKSTCVCSDDPPQIFSKSSASFSTCILRNSGLILIRAFFNVAVLSIPYSKWPVRMRLAENCNDAYNQPFSIASSICGEKSDTAVAPRGRISNAATTSRASLVSSIPNAVRMAARSFCASCNNICIQ